MTAYHHICITFWHGTSSGTGHIRIEGESTAPKKQTDGCQGFVVLIQSNVKTSPA